MLTYKQEIAEGIRKSGLTLQRIAKRIGSHKGYVSGIRSGMVAPPSPKITRRLCKVLGLDVDRMLALAMIEKKPKLLPIRALVNICDEILAMEQKAILDAAEMARKEPA